MPSGAGSSGGIVNCTSAGGAGCSATFAGENDISTLTFSATSATCWHLAGWSGDCAAWQINAGAWFVVDSARICNASFAIDTRTIGGVVQGLTGSGLVLQLNGANDVPIAVDGHFAFTPVFDYGTPCIVTIAAQPTGQTCFIPHGSGVVDRDVAVAVVCSEVPIPVAVSVTIDDGAPFALPGDTPTCVITVRNDGDATAYDVAVATDVMPAGALDAPAWSCSGDVALTVDVPAHSQATVQLLGTVVACSGATLDVTAQMAVPDWYVDTTGVHTATDSNASPTIFRNGFDGTN